MGRMYNIAISFARLILLNVHLVYMYDFAISFIRLIFLVRTI